MPDTTTLPHKTEFSVINDTQVQIVRIIEGTPEDVFDAYVNPDKLVQWWGPREHGTEVDKLDAKVPGEWRFFNVTTDGEKYGFHGVYHEVTEPSRIVQTFEFEGAPGYVSLDIRRSGGSEGGHRFRHGARRNRKLRPPRRVGRRARLDVRAARSAGISDSLHERHRASHPSGWLVSF